MDMAGQTPNFIIFIPVRFRIFPSLHNYINHKSKSWSTSNLFIALGDIILKDFQMRSTINVRNAVDKFYFLPRGDICLGCFNLLEL